MLGLTGEYICKLDAKGRMVVPALLKRKIPNIEQEGLVVNRGFEKNLVIYPAAEWQKMTLQIGRLNQFRAENRNFVRKFLSGATELTLDAASRILIPKTLLAYAGITSEVLLACHLGKIEVWSKEAYEATLDEMSENEFADLGEKVMGGLDFGGPTID